ncbi:MULTISPECIES: hypothetical protein [Terrabacteria group]|uniref:hypothetical protein n=1 Tax=Bacillati TaxID=1783272 RepID=UPI001939A732|nr:MULTISPECIES: hypothetical protein [Terrabacteria group]MBW9211889.1 hypothetical protein [Trueperella sp. zg.1013]QRG87308.1 hypothetical protein JOS54_03090 [Bulleidia sp. zg-1006]
MTNKNENYDDSFENIEKTVEDLKKKLQQLEEEKAESFEEDDVPREVNLFEEMKQNTKELKEETFQKVEDLEKKIADNEQFQKTLAYIKEHARKSRQKLSNTWDDVQSSEQWKTLSAKAKEGKEQFGKKVLPKVEEGAKIIFDKSREVIQSDFVQDTFTKVKEVGETIWHKIQDEINDKK